MNLRIKIPAIVAANVRKALGGCRSINSRLRGAVIESSREIYADLWRKWALTRFYSQSLWLRAIRFANARKEKVRNACTVSWLTIRAWLRSAETWQAQVDDNSRLRNEIVGLKNEIVQLKQQRINDENLVMNLFQYHDDRADQNHTHPVMLKVVIPAVRLALLRLKADVQGVYRGQ